MNFSLGYLFYRFFLRIYLFFYHWYVDGSVRFLRFFRNVFFGLEQGFAIRLTIRYFFVPLYKDYTIIGRIIGPIFRLGRIVIGLIIYCSAFLIILTSYLFWILIPPTLFFYGFSFS
jgi:hypothetical protein